MAEYTMELREYIEQFSQTETGLSHATIIETGRPNLFDFDYPIYDENYKKDFETHFIYNFYTREIGFEAEGLFKFKLENWLNINMPYFNNLFESELLTYDPLTNSKMDGTNDKTDNKTLTGKITGTDNATNNGSNNATVTDDNFERRIASDNPDSRLALTANDGEGVIEYANEIDEQNTNNSRTVSGSNNDTVSSTSEVDTNNTEDGTENVTTHREGKLGVVSYAKLLQEHRATFLRIEKEIFAEMQELFMGVY